LAKVMQLVNNHPKFPHFYHLKLPHPGLGFLINIGFR
jgi:hypothetical protein